MELRQIKTFVVVAKMLSFNRAAEVLNYAQSTVSAQIKLLEEEVGVPLFDRIGKKVFLTEAGNTLNRYGQKLISIENEAMVEVSGAEKSGTSLSLRIPQSIGDVFIPEIVKEFYKDFPKTDLDITSCMAMHSLQDELKSGIIDLAFLLSDSTSAKDIKTEILGFVPLVFAVSTSHRFAEAESLRINELDKESIIIAKHDCSYRMIFERMLTEHNVSPKPLIELNSLEAMKRFVINGVGTALLPLYAVEEEVRNNKIKAIPWLYGPEVALLMIWHKDKWLSPALERFMELTKDFVKRVKS